MILYINFKRSPTYGKSTTTCHPLTFAPKFPLFYIICQDAKNYWSPKITYIRGLDMLDNSRVADN